MYFIFPFINYKKCLKCFYIFFYQVSNSLHVNATSIAIRFHSEERKIQVIDNGIGIPKVELKTIAEYNNKNYCNYPIGYGIHNWKRQTLINIRRLSNAMMITSRCYNSSKTYMKVIFLKIDFKYHFTKFKNFLKIFFINRFLKYIRNQTLSELKEDLLKVPQ